MTTAPDAIDQTYTFTAQADDVAALLKVAHVAWHGKWSTPTADSLHVYRDPELGSTWLIAMGPYMMAAKTVVGDASTRFWGSIAPSQVLDSLDRARAVDAAEITWSVTHEGDTVTTTAFVLGEQLGEPVTVAAAPDTTKEYLTLRYDEVGAVAAGKLADALHALGLPVLNKPSKVGVKLTFDGDELCLESETGQTASIPARVTARAMVCVEGRRLRAAVRTIGRREAVLFSAHTYGGPDVDEAGVAYYPGLTRMDVPSKGLMMVMPGYNW